MEEVKLKRLEKLIDYFALGEIVASPKQLTGGLLHTVYEVTTQKGKYAVKELNAAIMKREEALINMVNSERIAKQLSKKIPAVAAIRKNEMSITHIDGSYYMLFPWQVGSSVFNEEITTLHCKKIGEVLGQIHKANIVINDLNIHKIQDEIYQWKNWCDRGRQINSIWQSVLEDALEQLYIWSERAARSSDMLQTVQVISHRDLDPKNVLWDKKKPYLIDWEAAGAINPYQEFIEVINYWTCNDRGEIDLLKCEAMLRGYQQYYDLSAVNWEIVMDSTFLGMLEWLAYNIKRSLGIESNEQEQQQLGTEQVMITLQELKGYAKRVKILISWLADRTTS